MKRNLLAAAVMLALLPFPAGATTGYFQHGYGIKAKSMGGVGIALPQDSLAAATNPAGMAWVGNRADGGIDWFAPDRGADIVGPVAVPGFTGSYDGNGRKSFLIPEFGYNHMISQNLALGVSVFGNGGMNTDYSRNPFGIFGGSNPAGVDLTQLFIAPTLAYKLNANHSLGVSLNLAYQQFAAQGLEGFDNPFTSSSPGNVTNRGRDGSGGWGLRFGWTGQVMPNVTLGATYQTKTHMGKFDKYKGLFAEQGGFDIPENFGIGIAVKAIPALTIAADVEQINYGKVQSVGNQTSFACLFAGTCPLGTSGGPGFGWRDTTVYKIGLAYELSPSVTLRGGYATLRQPIPSNQTLLNILAPGVVEDHLTLGATWQMSKQGELSASYMHGIEKKVSGSGSIPFIPGGFEANLRMKQDALGVGFGWKY
jgi:long-chain fatty acid transport protein